MRSILYPVCAVFAWIVVLSNARAVPAMRREPTRLTTWVMFVFFALIFTAGWSKVYNHLDSWTGLAESSRLIAQCLVVCFSATALALLQLWTYPPAQAARKVRATLTAKDMNWISIAPICGPIRAQVKIRNRHLAADATISPVGNDATRIEVRFDEPQRAVTPGQAAVLYDGDLLLGGGWIA